MHRPAALVITTLLLLALPGAPAFADPAPRPQLLERGYRVRHHDACGFLGESSTLPQGNIPRDRARIQDIECSPGGAWGEFVYLLEADPIAEEALVERVSFRGKGERFAFVERDVNGTDLSIAPLGWGGGQILFATASEPLTGAPDPNLLFSLVRWIDPSGAWDARSFVRIGYQGLLGPTAVDPTGAFSNDLFFVEGFTIVRMDGSGATSAFAIPPSLGPEMRFGPGGQWGNDLFVGGYIISPNGAVGSFPEVFGEFDWAQGGGFNGDMFELIPGSPSLIDRIQPDGTRSRFGSIQATQMAFCNGALWFAGDEGCYEVRAKGRLRNRRASGGLPLRGGTAP